jgi:hypothetical protein
VRPGRGRCTRRFVPSWRKAPFDGESANGRRARVRPLEDTADRGTGGLARYSKERALLPRLGFFIGNESRLPSDFYELIATIAPRPVLVVEPTMDRTTTPADVREAVARARQVYNLYAAADKLTIHEPVDYTRLTAATQDAAVRWMDKIHVATPVAAAAK